MSLTETMDRVEELTLEAAEAALEVYRSNFDVEYKSDEENSPLTEADRRAHRILVAGLEVLSPDVPIISEESSRNTDYDTRSDFDRFWLVDPLDGTREFVKKNGEFTVNVGLIEYGVPVAGVVVAPDLDRLYRSDGSEAVVKHGSETRRLGVSETTELGRCTLVRSRSHSGDRMETLMEKLPFGRTVKQGSSLKICRVAEGEADVYCRFRPTWEWDTAAADAILRMAGGKFTEPDGNTQVYNKPSLKNKRGLLVTNGLVHEQVSEAMTELMQEQPES